MTSRQMDFLSAIEGKVAFDEPLHRYTSFGIGGPVEAFMEPKDLPSLQKIIRFCFQEGISVFIIGKGTNLLIKDEGIRGVTIRLTSSPFSSIRVEGEKLYAGAGASLSEVLRVSKEHNLSGLEFTAGVCATVGGAIKTNLNTTYPQPEEIRRKVEYVRVMDEKGDLGYLSHIEDGWKGVILEVGFILRRKKKKEIERRIEECIAYRKRTQEIHLPSAGCIFKNPIEGKPAGWLIEQCGLKGKRIGGAEVSSKHSNFIINPQKKAKAKDVLALIQLIQREVKNRFNLFLDLEIEVLG